jgi:hypothetical protein
MKFFRAKQKAQHLAAPQADDKVDVLGMAQLQLCHKLHKTSAASAAEVRIFFAVGFVSNQKRSSWLRLSIFLFYFYFTVLE